MVKAIASQSSRRDDPNRPQASISCAGKGAIIEVYWPGDNEWYRGKVGKIESKSDNATNAQTTNGTKDKSKEGSYRIDYLDGDTEWLDLRKERWTLVKETAKSAEPVVKKAVPSSKRMPSGGAGRKEQNIRGSGKIRVNSTYDSGNIEVVDAEDASNIRVKIRRDPYCNHDKTAHYQWFNFRLTGVSNASLVLHIENAGTSSFPEAWPGYLACASYDLDDWFRVPTEWDPDKGVITIKHTSTQDSLYIAYFAPYTLNRHAHLVAKMQTRENVRLEVLGQSLEGRDMDMLVIGDEGADKRKVWIIARQHPGESMAEWFMEGFLETLTDEHNAFSHRLLKHAVIYAVPNMNPDGSYHGHLRTNLLGANLNREWASPTMQYSPEVYLVLDKMGEVGCDLFLDIHGDEEIPFNFLAGDEGIPSYDSRLGRLSAAFTTAFERATPDFQSKNGYGVDPPGQADLTIASNAVGEKFKCVSFTLEMPFKDTQDSPDSVHGWNPARAKNFGASMLQPIYEVASQLRDPDTSPASLQPAKKARV